MKKRMLSLLLACAICVGLLPGAVADSGAEAPDVPAEAAGRSGAAASETAKQETRIYHARGDEEKADDPEEDTGISFHPYVFEVSGDSRVRASVKMQPGLMRTNASDASNSGAVGTGAPGGELVEIGEPIGFIENSTNPVYEGNLTIHDGDKNSTTIVPEWNSTGIETEWNMTEIIGNTTVITPVAEKVPELLSASLDGQDLSVSFVSGMKHLADNPDPVCFKLWEYTTNATLSVGSPYTVGGQIYYPRTYAKIEAVDPMVHISTGGSTTVSLTKTMDVMGRDPVPGELLYIAVEEMVNNVSLGRSNLITVQIPGGMLSFDQITIRLTPEKGVYTGEQNKPAVEVLYHQVTLQQDRDYTVKYGENINAGSGSVTVIGMGGYEGSCTAAFDIEPAEMNPGNTVITLENSTFIATGKEIEPEVVSVTVEGRTLTTEDYDVSYAYNIEAGTGIVAVTGKGNYTGGVQETFEIIEGENTEPITLTKNNTRLTITPKSKDYSGKEYKPKVKVVCNGKELKQNTDYTLSYSNNINAGTAYAIVTGKGRYTGEVKGKFTIKKIKNELKDVIKPREGEVAYPRGTKIKLVIKLKQKVSSDKIRFKLTKVKKLINGEKATQTVKKKDWGFDVSKNGSVTVKKNAERGTYYLTLKITIDDDGMNYKKTTITKEYKIKVKE